MKRILSVALLLAALYSCAPTPEQIRAKNIETMNELIADTLSQRMSQIGYNAISFSEPDTVYTTFNNFDLEYFKVKVNIAKNAMETWENVPYMRKYYEEEKATFEQYSDSVRILEEQKAAFVPELLGYRVTHTFGGKKGNFAKMTVKSHFVIDPTLTEILSEENEDVDWGDLTIADILKMTADLPIESLFE